MRIRPHGLRRFRPSTLGLEDALSKQASWTEDLDDILVESMLAGIFPNINVVDGLHHASVYSRDPVGGRRFPMKNPYAEALASLGDFTSGGSPPERKTTRVMVIPADNPDLTAKFFIEAIRQGYVPYSTHRRYVDPSTRRTVPLKTLPKDVVAKLLEDRIIESMEYYQETDVNDEPIILSTETPEALEATVTKLQTVFTARRRFTVAILASPMTTASRLIAEISRPSGGAYANVGLAKGCFLIVVVPRKYMEFSNEQERERALSPLSSRYVYVDGLGESGNSVTSNQTYADLDSTLLSEMTLIISLADLLLRGTGKSVKDFPDMESLAQGLDDEALLPEALKTTRTDTLHMYECPERGDHRISASLNLLFRKFRFGSFSPHIDLDELQQHDHLVISFDTADETAFRQSDQMYCPVHNVPLVFVGQKQQQGVFWNLKELRRLQNYVQMLPLQDINHVVQVAYSKARLSGRFNYETFAESLQRVAAQKAVSKTPGLSVPAEQIEWTSIVMNDAIYNASKDLEQAIANSLEIRGYLMSGQPMPREIKEMLTRYRPLFIFQGPPGTGKTIVAHALSDYLTNHSKIPNLHYNTLFFNMTELLNRYVGESEERMRNVLRMLENLPATIVVIDEAFKQIQQGTGDGGAADQVGTNIKGLFISWLTDASALANLCRNGTFIIMTTNQEELESFRRMGGGAGLLNRAHTLVPFDMEISREFYERYINRTFIPVWSAAITPAAYSYLPEDVVYKLAHMFDNEATKQGLVDIIMRIVEERKEAMKQVRTSVAEGVGLLNPREIDSYRFNFLTALLTDYEQRVEAGESPEQAASKAFTLETLDRRFFKRLRQTAEGLLLLTNDPSTYGQILPVSSYSANPKETKPVVSPTGEQVNTGLATYSHTNLEEPGVAMTAPVSTEPSSQAATERSIRRTQPGRAGSHTVTQTTPINDID